MFCLFKKITHVDRCNEETTEWYEKHKIDDVNKHVTFICFIISKSNFITLIMYNFI